VNDKKDTIDPKERCLAMLTLQIRGLYNVVQNKSGIKASDEDLISLLEGVVNDVDRVRILHAIAHDPDSYSRWLELVKTSDPVVEDCPAEQQNNLKQLSKPSLWRWLYEWVTPLKLTGAVLASATIVYILTIATTAPLYESQISKLYAEVRTGSLFSNENLTSKRVEVWPIDKKIETVHGNKDITLRIIAEGIQAGLDSLGENLTIPGMEYDKFGEASHVELSTIPKDDRKVLHGMGRLLALSYFQCQYNVEESFFNNVLNVYGEMVSQTGPQSAVSVELDFLQNLSKYRVIDSKRKAKDIVCAFTANTVRRLRNVN
jgi:hypothetical protein